MSDQPIQTDLGVNYGGSFIGKSPYEQFSGRHLWLANTIAGAQKQNLGLESLFGAAAKGMSPDDLEIQQQQERLKELSAQMAQDTSHLDDKQFNQYQSQLADEVNKRITPPERTTQPINPWVAGAAALASVFDPKHAFQTGGAVFQSQSDQADKQYGIDTATYNDAVAEHQRRVAGLNTLADNEQNHSAMLERIHESNQNHLTSLYNNAQNALTRAQAGKDTNTAKAWDRYLRANQKGEKLSAAAQLRSLDPQFAPTDQQVKADIYGLAHNQVKDFANEVSRVSNQFGEVDPQNFAALDKQRRFIADNFFDGNLDALPPIPTGETLRKQAFDEKKAEYKQTYTRLTNNHRDLLTEQAANLALAKRRLAVAQANSAVYGQNAINTEAYRQWQMAQKTAKPAFADAMNDYQDDLDKLTVQRDKAKDGKVKSDYQRQIDKTNTEMQSLLKEGFQTLTPEEQDLVVGGLPFSQAIKQSMQKPQASPTSGTTSGTTIQGQIGNETGQVTAPAPKKGGNPNQPVRVVFQGTINGKKVTIGGG